jgi:prefoldin subunit 5
MLSIPLRWASCRSLRGPGRAAEAGLVSIQQERLLMKNNPSISPQIDLNQADLETLTTLPGIGSALAARIIRFREEVHPFEETIDVIAVPGISEKMYHQLADRVTVSPPGQVIPEASPQIDSISDDQAPETETDAISTEMEEVREMTTEIEEKIALPPVENLPATSMAAPQPKRSDSWRFWLVAILGAIGGALLALLVLHSINGTLNMATHPQVLHLNNQVADLNEDISALRERLNQMEALSGRLQNAETEIEALNETLTELNEQITTLEKDVRQVQTDVRTLNEGVSTHGEQIATLEQDTAKIQETVSEIEAAADRFDNFLNGLRELLLTTEGTATPTAPLTASPTPTERVEPTYTPTVSPSTPAAATATRTPRPTRTPTPTPTVSGL